MPSSGVVRWGILGPGSIAARFMRNAREAAHAEVVAVGSRTPERAAAFAASFGISRAHGSYEALLDDAAVDAVYIGLPNSLHHPWTIRALAAGKHVLCEKPYSRHPAEVAEAFDAADAAGRVLMEAFMWRHTPQARRFLELLPEVGRLQAIRASFSFRIEDQADVRLAADLDGGSLMDVGCYSVSGARLVAGSEPLRVHGEQTLAPSGVDMTFAGLLRFPDEVIATITSGFTSDDASLEAVGDASILVMRSPWQGKARALWLGDREIPVAPVDPYPLELENMSAAILGEAPPLLGREDALGQARAIAALYESAASGAVVAVER
ncbi:MAG TPA: Gfo/Idh/MocA family oxidoreductase [Coriobacteriia bacterium]